MRYRPLGSSPEDDRLGRYIPDDWRHVEEFPVRPLLARADFEAVEKVHRLPYWHWSHDQGSEGACVGFGGAMALAIINTQERRSKGLKVVTRRYDPWWLWDRSKERDEWPETNPGDSEGTSVRASMDVLRDLGAVVYDKRRTRSEPELAEGIHENRWAENVDEMRACIGRGVPISIGVNWYANFDRPEGTGRDMWIGRGDLGRVRGGHCVCIYGASDRRQAFRVKNSWGRDYPLVWLPYETMQRLLDEYGEATIITDRIV